MRLRPLQLLALLATRVAVASVTLEDPSDTIPASDWAADSAIVPDYNVPFLEYQPSDSEHPFLSAEINLVFLSTVEFVIQLTKATRAK